jgi:hypothetical protein
MMKAVLHSRRVKDLGGLVKVDPELLKNGQTIYRKCGGAKCIQIAAGDAIIVYARRIFA